ncbi:MAG: hypothetical protein ING75_05525 [Rhodocyclaceae bacterium]|nr:hypothetical protein [Rhodocyclaceae bacterium]
MKYPIAAGVFKPKGLKISVHIGEVRFLAKFFGKDIAEFTPYAPWWVGVALAADCAFLLRGLAHPPTHIGYDGSDGHRCPPHYCPRLILPSRQSSKLVE